MGRVRGVVVLLVSGALVVACGGGESKPAEQQQEPGDVITPPPPPVVPAGPEPTVSLAAPVKLGDWTFYGAQGEKVGVYDASADEGGNVYLAANDAIFAKKREEAVFKRFSATDAGLTSNCSEDGKETCPVVSIAGAQPGRVIVGFQGIGTDGDLVPDWEKSSGGADVLGFDGAKLAKERHVLLASVPGHHEYDWESYHVGRRKMRQTLRIAVQHDQGRGLQYGDVWFAGTHGSFAVLIANAAARGWVDETPQYPQYADAKDVWEHDHPAIHGAIYENGVKKKWAMLTGSTYALALDPRTGDPWAANDFRLTLKKGYGASRSGWNIGQFLESPNFWDPRTFYDIWPDPYPADPTDANFTYTFDAQNPAYVDAVTSLSFCPDGTLWIGSGIHGLARRAPGEPLAGDVFEEVAIPSWFCWPDAGTTVCSVWAVACDPTDSSLWVGFGGGGIGRLKNGTWTYAPDSAPGFARGNPVRNIQIDRWGTTRIVYFAHVPTWQGANGGLSVYSGP